MVRGCGGGRGLTVTVWMVVGGGRLVQAGGGRVDRRLLGLPGTTPSGGIGETGHRGRRWGVVLLLSLVVLGLAGDWDTCDPLIQFRIRVLSVCRE